MLAKRNRWRGHGLVLFVILLLPAFTIADPSLPRLPDGAIYQGGMRDGLFHGRGHLRWPNGRTYTGEFRHGLIHGEGEMHFANGDIYVGGFRDGMMHGQGVLTLQGGERYEGEFARDMMHGAGVFYAANGDVFYGDFFESRAQGQGRIEYANGNIYDGGIANWQPHGEGTLIIAMGGIYSGSFVDGVLDGRGTISDTAGEVYEGEVRQWRFHGKGRLVLPDGSIYEGDFVDGRYHGKGVFTYKNGDRYEGEFANGVFHGAGAFIYKEPRGRKKRLTGNWKHGRYVPPDDGKPARETQRPRLEAETLLYGESARLAARLDEIAPGRPGVPELYFVAFAGHGGQDVFMKEALYSRDVFRNSFGAAGRSLALINNPALAGTHPLATVTNLERTLERVAARMNRDEDILFLFLTSHGGRDHVLDVSLPGVPLRDLAAGQLADLLERVGIRWKVVVVSACYSGGFISALADDDTLVMSSASADRTSFGCSDEAEFTFFGRALLEQSLTRTDSFREAFVRARQLVARREAREGYDHSKPQIHVGPRIAEQLRRWRERLAAEGGGVQASLATH